MSHRPVADHGLGKTDLVHTPYKYTQIILPISPDIYAVVLMSVLQDKHAMCLASDSRSTVGSTVHMQSQYILYRPHKKVRKQNVTKECTRYFFVTQFQHRFKERFVLQATKAILCEFPPFLSHC